MEGITSASCTQTSHNHQHGMFFFKTYCFCTIWIEIAMRKGSTAPTTCNVDCSTLQTSKPNHPTTYTYINTHTNNNQSMHTCIHSFIQFTIFTLSQERTKHHHCHSSQSSINHQPCISRTMTRTRWNGMHLHAYRLSTTTLQRYIHPYMHA